MEVPKPIGLTHLGSEASIYCVNQYLSWKCQYVSEKRKIIVNDTFGGIHNVRKFVDLHSLFQIRYKCVHLYVNS